MRDVRTRSPAGYVLAIVLAACSSTPAQPPAATWPVSREPLPDATSEIPADYGPATWALDPDAAPPAAETTELNILVWERACSSGNPATGRISAPVVEYTTTTVTITIGVRPLEVPPGTGVTCPMPPGTPASLRLVQPLDERTLLDGGSVPPAPPSPANQ